LAPDDAGSGAGAKADDRSHRPRGVFGPMRSEAKAKRTRDDFFPRPMIEPDVITGLGTVVKDAVALKFTATS
jgi:hypothetical protein